MRLKPRDAPVDISTGINTGDQDLSNLLVKSNNLSDLTDVNEAHRNLNLGSLAMQSGAFSGSSIGINTGDHAINRLYQGLVSNAIHTGDAIGSHNLSVVGLNGINLASLGTGLLKITLGIPSLAIGADFPTLNQNTTGTAANGIPVGGTTGQVLAKVDGTDYNTHWVTGGGGGGSGDALTSNPLSQFAATTKAQLNGVVSDGDVMYIGDAPTTHTHTIANITDFGTYSTDIHANITALNAVSGVNTGDQNLSGLLVKASNLSDLTNVVTARSNLGLGSLATQSGTFSGTSSGTNTGDQSTIVGITGTKAQFNVAITDGNFMYSGDAPTAHTHTISDITDFGTYSTDIHSNIAALDLVSGTNTGDQTSIVGITGTKSQFNTAVSDGDILFTNNITGTPDGTKFLRDDYSWQTVSGGGSSNIEGGSSSSVYGGTSAIDGGLSNTF